MIMLATVGGLETASAALEEHDDMSVETDGARGGTAIQKAFRLMHVLFEADGPQPLSDLAEQLEMPKPSVHRLLNQLEEVGAVQRDLSGRGYTVGPSLVRLAVGALSARVRQPPVRAVMRKLVDEIGESCNLSILHEQEVLYLERVECDWPLRMQLSAGSRVPIHATASGKLLIAQMTPRHREKLLQGLRLEKFTANTITDLAALETECQAIRACGYSINREEYHLGLIGVATPIFGKDRAVVATLSIHAPVFRMSADAALGHLPHLQRAAEEIADEAQLRD